MDLQSLEGILKSKEIIYAAAGMSFIIPIIYVFYSTHRDIKKYGGVFYTRLNVEGKEKVVSVSDLKKGTPPHLVEDIRLNPRQY